jgi:signal transduction histidine kinase
VIAEALTNASKHAAPDRIAVRVGMGDGHATVEVRDDGSGGVDTARGSGLSGLADRVSALGGTLEIDSPAGAGTAIRARIPLTAPGQAKQGPGADVEYAHA